MGRELETEQDLEKLSEEWERKGNGKRAGITRIEDIPNIEDVSGAKIEWVLEGMLAEGALHMLTSDSGAGKSTLIAALAYAVSVGASFLGRATKKRPVLILDAENPLAVMCERFARIRITTHSELRVWGQWLGETVPSAGGAIVQEWVARCVVKPLIIVDTVIAFHPGTENDSNETRRYMEQYRALTAMGATVLLLHHIGKSETSRDYRGSSDYKASIDIGYKLTNLGDGARLGMLELRPFKQRFSVEPVLRIIYQNDSFIADESEQRKTVTELLCELLKANSGITKSDFESLAATQNLGRNRARDFLADGIKAGTIRVEVGAKNSRLNFWNADREKEARD